MSRSQTRISRRVETSAHPSTAVYPIGGEELESQEGLKRAVAGVAEVLAEAGPLESQEGLKLSCLVRGILRVRRGRI